MDSDLNPIDLNYADDLGSLSSRYKYKQQKTELLSATTTKTRLKINPKKTQILRVTATDSNQVQKPASKEC